MKILLTIFSILFLITISGCQSDSRDNSRAYVEGKIAATPIDFNEITITINSDNTIVAETIPLNSGAFTLSGPLISDSFSLVLNKKIKSFSASKPGCAISPDGLQILVPSGTTYLIFNEIILE